MPTTALTVTPGPSPYSVHGKAVAMAAADVANGNHFAASALQLVIAHNTGGSSRTVTIDSKPLPTYQREADVAAEPIAAGEIRVFKLPSVGWKDATTGNITLSANHTDVKFGVVDLTQEVMTA